MSLYISKVSSNIFVWKDSMGIDLNSLNGYSVGLNPNLKVNNFGKFVYFCDTKNVDTFQNNSPVRLFEEAEIKKMIANSPEVKKILAEHKIPVHLNMKEIQELRDGHAKDTQNIAVAIANNLPPALKQQVNMATLKEGALLHDFGKVLIPPAILNKNGSLTDDEHKIMDLHTELGYYLLKNTGVSESVLSLVRNHHDNYLDNNSGRSYVPDINLQILNVADKYSALTEKRVYKDAYEPQRALTVIYGDVQRGEVHPFLFNALVKATQTNSSQPIVK